MNPKDIDNHILSVGISAFHRSIAGTVYEVFKTTTRELQLFAFNNVLRGEGNQNLKEAAERLRRKGDLSRAISSRVDARQLKKIADAMSAEAITIGGCMIELYYIR